MLKDSDVVKKSSTRKIVVTQNGIGDFTTIQEAIDSVPEKNSDRVIIFVEKGLYDEVITIPKSKPFISLIGESKNSTIISHCNYAGKKKKDNTTFGTGGSATAFLFANDLIIENLSIVNAYDKVVINANGSQAVAARINGERVLFKNVNLKGQQDTLYAEKGTQYFYHCFIEGDVDFIFGGARAVFEECEIHSLDRGADKNNGYVTAASTMNNQPYGFLFIHCNLFSNAAEGTVHLGRPWHPGGNPDAIGSVLFRECFLGEHISAQGWTEMGGFSPLEARLYEYQNYGPGAIPTESRRILTTTQADEYTVENILDGWKPNT